VSEDHKERKQLQMVEMALVEDHRMRRMLLLRIKMSMLNVLYPSR